MKINKLYICLVMMLFNTMVYSNEFDEFGGGFGDDMVGLYWGGQTRGYDYSYGAGNFGFNGAQQRMINDAINSVHATPQTTYSFNYVNEKYTAVGNLSPTDKNRYVPSPNDYIVPWRIDPTTGEQWYTLYRNFVPGYFNLVATTTMVNGAKSSVGYNFESTHVSDGTDFSNMNAYGGINFGGIDRGYTTTTSPPVIFTPVTTTNLMDKAILNGGQLRTLMNNLKNGPYTMREAPYVYIDSNDKTRMGYLTIIRNTTNGETLRYFFDTVANYDNHIKLPIANGIELQPCGGVNSGCSYNAGGIVSVTTWDGTNNQPELSLPNWHLVIHQASGLQLIVVPLERPASNQNVQPEKAYYNAIPRIYRPNFVPGADRDTAELLYENNDSLSLEQALFIKREYFDVQVPDLKGAIDVYMQNLITKVSNGLPDDLKPDAEEILIEYANSVIVTETISSTNLFVEGQNYVFDEQGKPKRAGAAGNLIQIEINNVLKLPSQLDGSNLDHRIALSKIGVFFAVQLHAPIGTILSSGIFPTDPKALAYTEGRFPYTIRYNYKSGKFNENLNNIYNFKSVTKHELLHRADKTAPTPVESNLSTHIDVYLAQMSHVSFVQTTDNNVNDFKLSTIRSMAIYILNMDKKRNQDNTFKYTKTDIKDKMDTFNNLNLHYKLVYPVTGWTQGQLTIGIKDTNTLNTPEDANASYYPINEK